MLFERLLSLRSDVGLFSEEYEPRMRRLVGNFLKVFSRLALDNSANNLAYYENLRSSVWSIGRRLGPMLPAALKA